MSRFATIALDACVEDVDNRGDEIVWAVSGRTELTVTVVERVPPLRLSFPFAADC